MTNDEKHTLNKTLFIILPNLTCFVEKNSHFLRVDSVHTTTNATTNKCHELLANKFCPWRPRRIAGKIRLHNEEMWIYFKRSRSEMLLT